MDAGRWDVPIGLFFSVDPHDPVEFKEDKKFSITPNNSCLEK